MASDKIKNTYDPAKQGDSSPTQSTGQPPQGSQRRSHEHEPEKPHAPERQPARTGTSTPGAQGAKGRPSGTGDERKQEEADSGEPRATHTRAGRQKTPGKRG
jgi:hypothetical protein